jgi:dihydropteroate synthase
MGILNITPDSFYAASRMTGEVASIVDTAGQMVRDGATILDVGGMSTRPGAPEISEAEELDRVLPVVTAIAEAFPEIVVAVDTYRAGVAREALAAGARMINDISGFGRDPDMPATVARAQAAYVLMHMRGTPSTMSQMTDYEDVVGDVLKYFVSKIRALSAAGIHEVLVDPGFGFAKTPAQNYRLIDRLATFRLTGCPVLVGVSRKSTLQRTVGRDAAGTLDATTALHMAALLNGASVLRVHDVRPAADAIVVYRDLMAARHAQSFPGKAPLYTS